MKYNLVHACAYEPAADLAPRATTGSIAELIDLHGARIAGEIKRLRVNSESRDFVIFDPCIGYYQCSSQPTREVYCEAQSADTWAAVSSVLTPERVAVLRAAGYADPGHAPNYSKTFPASTTETENAREALTILHDVYGYAGAAPLKVKTEKDLAD